MAGRIQKTIHRRCYSPVHRLQQRLQLSFSLAGADEASLPDGLLKRRRACSAALVKAKRRFVSDFVTGAGSSELNTRFSDALGLAIARCVRLAKRQTQLSLGEGRFAVFALGKLGAREANIASDADLVFLYAPQPDRALAAAEVYERFATEVIAMIGWSPQWPQIAEVDCRLRPHGGDGPLAIHSEALVSYLRHEAWTWELQTYTRLRPICGDAGLIADVLKETDKAIRQRAASLAIFEDILEMRDTLAQNKPAKSLHDVKHLRGGLMDLEFLCQGLSLKAAADSDLRLCGHTPAMIENLVARGSLTPRQGQSLTRIWQVYTFVRNAAAARQSGFANGAAPGPERYGLNPIRKAASEVERLIREKFEDGSSRGAPSAKCA
ncbi:MAG: hypothetical protein ACXU8U_00495 [Asticcacaulis sp.]